MSSLLGMTASNSLSPRYISAVMSRHSCKSCTELLNALMMARLCLSAVQSFEMIEPDMQIECSSLSLLMIDITTLTIETWCLDISSVWSCFQFVARFRRCNLCLVLITLGLVLSFHAIYDVLIFPHFTAQIQNDFLFIIDLIFISLIRLELSLSLL